MVPSPLETLQRLVTLTSFYLCQSGIITCVRNGSATVHLLLLLLDRGACWETLVILAFKNLIIKYFKASDNVGDSDKLSVTTAIVLVSKFLTWLLFCTSSLNMVRRTQNQKKTLDYLEKEHVLPASFTFKSKHHNLALKNNFKNVTGWRQSGM